MVGDFFGAERFVEVSNVHMMGDYEVMGDAGCDYLKSLLAHGARVCVPTTRNAQCIGYNQAQRLRQSPALIEGEKHVRQLLTQLGILLVSNSAKLVNIIKAHGYEPVLRPTDDCVETAISGRLP